MTEALLSGIPPRRLLLATDLTSACDRAFDRAVQLALAWGAELHVIHAMQAPPPSTSVGIDEMSGIDERTYRRKYPDPRARVVRQLRRLVDHGGLSSAVLHVEETPPAQAILTVAGREACDLLILGESRSGRSGIVESTQEHVVRKAPVSVLVVRNRAYAPYRTLLVGTDFTDEAQQAVAVAARIFPAADIALMHAYQLPYGGLLGSAPQASTWVAEQLARLRSHLDAAELSPKRKASIRTLVAIGPPAEVLRRHVEEQEVELTVIGAHPRGMLSDAVVGSSRLILASLSSDILVVRAVRRDAQQDAP